MSDWTRKTRHAGPPPRDQRKIDKDPARLPPHAKQRTYVLTIRVTTTKTLEFSDRFPTKAAMEQGKQHMLKNIKAGRYYDYSWGRKVVKHVKHEPEIVETTE